MSSDFFESNSYFIDEKVNLFKFENAYMLYDGKGQHIGAIKQVLTTGQKMLRLLINKAIMPFMLQITDIDGKVQATVSRGWTFWMSKIVISDGNGQALGTISQKFKLFKPTFKIYDNAGILAGEISGDWKAWNFKISDNKGSEIGGITKKWAGAMKEIFTTADKYNVTINENYPDKKNKLIILAGAITIDMVLKEAK
jgi:uncharacterized protein YxjI